ncbi:MAG: transposase [Candidatus Promineifilaceae bacterium]
MRKQYPPTFKAKAVLELLKEEKTLGQLAGEYQVHVNQLRDWRQRLLDELPQIFSRERQVSESELKKRDQLIEQLYGEVGRLTTELNWLQKKWSQH